MPTAEMERPPRAFGVTPALCFFDVMQLLRFCGAYVADELPDPSLLCTAALQWHENVEVPPHHVMGATFGLPMLSL